MRPLKNAMLDTLRRLAVGVFNILAPLELSSRPSDVAALQKSISVEGGVGELALRYVHYIHRKPGFGRLPMEWHTDISRTLEGLAEELEAKWWEALNGHPAFEGGTPRALATAGLPELTHEQTPVLRVNNETALRIWKFIGSVAEVTGKRITKTMIWTVAGYKSRTDFEQFQREDSETTDTAIFTSHGAICGVGSAS